MSALLGGRRVDSLEKTLMLGGIGRGCGFDPLLPHSSVGKESAYNAGDPGSIPGSGRSPGGNGNPLQCSCLENLRDGGAWWAAISGVAQSRTRLKRLSIA